MTVYVPYYNDSTQFKRGRPLGAYKSLAGAVKAVKDAMNIEIGTPNFVFCHDELYSWAEGKWEIAVLEVK
jgi:hypothetical protein